MGFFLVCFHPEKPDGEGKLPGRKEVVSSSLRPESPRLLWLSGWSSIEDPADLVRAVRT
jgi:hypothetical protein